MKQTILGVALLACCLFSCKSSQNAAVSDPNSANMPKAECGAGKADAGCADKAAASCGEKAASSCCKKPQG
jgi:hypothetical protein